MTNEVKQNLFKAVAAITSFAFASTGHDLAEPLNDALVGLAGSVSGQFGIELCMPYITKKWLTHPEKSVSNHIQRSLVSAIHKALKDIESEYLGRDDTSSQEARSLRDFLIVLRDRSQSEYVEVTNEELSKQEVIDYVYNPATSIQHLQTRLRIGLDISSDEFYFTDRFIAFFPNRFAELVQFYFKEELKGEDAGQKKAKKAMDLLFFDTLNAGLFELRTGQQEHQQLLDRLLRNSEKTLQKTEFYGELWISAIRRNQRQIDQIERDTKETLNLLHTETSTKTDVAELRKDIQRLYSQPVSPGLLLSERFQQLASTVRETETDFITSQEQLIHATKALTALQTTIDINPDLATNLSLPLQQQQQTLSNSKSSLLAADANQRHAKQKLADFLWQVAVTQKAIQDTTSHRADKARILFEQGRFIEASAALNTDDLRHDQADLLLQRDSLQQQLQQLASDFILKAELTLLNKENNWFSEAKQLYIDAINCHESAESYSAFAFFLYDHNQHTDAISNYLLALNLTYIPSKKVLLFTKLADLYRITNQITLSEQTYNQAMILNAEISEENTPLQIANSRMISYSLAILYRDTNRFNNAIECYSQIINSLSDSPHNNDYKGISNLAGSLDGLGIVYKRASNFAEAEQKYNEALSLRRQLVDQNSDIYSSDLSVSLNNIGILYSDLERFYEANRSYEESLKIRRHLSEKNPYTYLPDVATSLNNLGLMHIKNSNTEEAKIYYQECLDIRIRLAKINPDAYNFDLSVILYNMGELYFIEKNYDISKSYYNECLDMRRQLIQKSPQKFLSSLANALNSAAKLYIKMNSIEDSERLYQEALGIRLELAKENPDPYSLHVAETSVGLGDLYQLYNKVDKSIDFCLSALESAWPFKGNSPYTSEIIKEAITICERHHFDWRSELVKRSILL